MIRRSSILFAGLLVVLIPFSDAGAAPALSPVPNKATDQLLADIQGAYHSSPPIVLAAATLAILPTVAVFLLAQRYFVEGVATTGLKG